MNTNSIMNAISRKFYRANFKIKKHSPEILLVVGIAGVVTSAVMACKATTKASDILEETAESVKVIHEGMEKGEIREHEYTEEDGKKDLSIVYAQTGLKFIKLYAPSVALGTLSIVSILASHNVMRKRNVALAAAYTTIDQSFKDYRARLVDRFGKELDRELRYNIKAQEIEETVVDEEGKEKKVVTTVKAVDPNTYSDYARIYDDGCIGWTKSPELNLAFLKQTQEFANRKLQTEGYLFLNDVYEMLGFPKTAAGQIVGWYYDDEGLVGDNFVDFGIYNLDNERARAFANCRERTIVLDFNVDGNILEYV